ncbi:MAG: hypothetical protein EXX96DRAFT_589641 [Benjaminiella poitrasii]|nr:MAG: hypothetical protein EXX96DRAFT_589641 [Benjaminiella poitrasii]
MTDHLHIICHICVFYGYILMFQAITSYYYFILLCILILILHLLTFILAHFYKDRTLSVSRYLCLYFSIFDYVSLWLYLHASI